MMADENIFAYQGIRSRYLPENVFNMQYFSGNKKIQKQLMKAIDPGYLNHVFKKA